MPEGDDKPAKYPVMFRGADLALITKVDLLPYIEEFSVERARASLRQVGYGATSSNSRRRGGAGFEAWLAWLRARWPRRAARRGESLRRSAAGRRDAHARSRGLRRTT